MVECILTYCPKAAIIVEILEEYIVDVHFLIYLWEQAEVSSNRFSNMTGKQSR